MEWFIILRQDKRAIAFHAGRELLIEIAMLKAMGAAIIAAKG